MSSRRWNAVPAERPVEAGSKRASAFKGRSTGALSRADVLDRDAGYNSRTRSPPPDRGGPSRGEPSCTSRSTTLRPGRRERAGRGQARVPRGDRPGGGARPSQARTAMPDSSSGRRWRSTRTSFDRPAAVRPDRRPTAAHTTPARPPERQQAADLAQDAVTPRSADMRAASGRAHRSGQNNPRDRRRHGSRWWQRQGRQQLRPASGRGGSSSRQRAGVQARPRSGCRVTLTSP